MTSATECLVLAFLIGGSLWCIAGDIELALTVYPSDAAGLFTKDPDGFYRLHPEDVPDGFRHSRWEEAIKDLLDRGLAMEDPDRLLILTERGVELRNASTLL